MQLEKHNDLIKKNIPLVRAVANKNYQTYGDQWDDVIQEGYLGLIKAIDNDKDQGLYYHFISSAMKDYIRKERKESFEPIQGENLIFYDKISEDFFGKITKHLPEQGKKVICWYFQDDLTCKEISQRLDVSECWAWQLLKQYKDEIRESYTRLDVAQEIYG